MCKVIFITGTDTGIGKTYATAVLGLLLKQKGLNVGVMKPVQCAGDDAKFLKKVLEVDDPLEIINPCYAPEPLSPHLAFKRSHQKIDLDKIFKAYQTLKDKYDVLLIEGAGGLMVPLKENYFVADLIKDLEAEVIIVSRLGLGTINHTLLTLKQARDFGLKIKGIIFNETKKSKIGIPEKTNPRAVKEFGDIKVLGHVPFLKSFKNVGSIQLDLKSILSEDKKDHAILSQWDKEYLWHPFTQMKDWLTDEPLIINRAQGSYLIDTKGNHYLDGVSSLWVNVHGHRKREIDQTIKSQINQLSHSTLLGLSNTPAVKLAKKLIDIAPKGLKKVFYSDNGSTSVEIAVKIAYQYWQNIGQTKKTGVVHLANSYHGDTLGSVSVGGIDLFHKVYRKLIFKTIKVDLDNFESVIKKNHRRVACFVVEPLVQGAAGMIMWPKGILKKMAHVCKKYDVIFIADEVATGFGRTGKMFACEHENVTPDILCLAKGITGGYLPLAATLTTQKIYDGFLFDYKDQKTFFHGHTYTGNPLACAAALANIELFKKERTLKRLSPKIKYLAKRLKMFYNLPHVDDVRQCGFMVGIELVKNKTTKDPFAWQERIGVKVCHKVRERGVILRPLGNVIVLMPPLSISLKEIDHLIESAYWAIQETV